MHRIFVVLAIILAFSLQNHAQTKHSTPKIDSLIKAFESAKYDSTRLKVLLNAPSRIDEYFYHTTPIYNLYERGVQLAKRLNDKKSIVSFLVVMAYLQMYALTDEPKAFDLYTEALKYTEQEKDYRACASIFFEMAAISEHQNFIEEMYKYLYKSIEYTEKSAVIFIKPYRWLNYMYLEENKINEALKMGYQGVKYADDRSASADVKALIYGVLYMVLKKIPTKKQEAQDCKEKVIELLNQIEKVSDDYYLKDIATVCYEVEQYQLAIAFANQVFKLSKVNKQVVIWHQLSYKVVADSYERLGQHQKSLENYKKYSDLYVNFLKSTVSLESGRKVIRAEGERNLLMKQNEVEKERFYRNLSFAIAAFVLLLGGVVLAFYKREQRQKRELTQLNATKDKLFAILSHDLRSPVGALENNVMLTNWGALTQEEFVEATQNLGQEIRQVRTMLDNVLNWSISQLGGMKPHPKRLSLNEAIQEQLTLLKPAADAKSIALLLQIKESVFVNADKNHLAIIFRNLLQNAIKFTHSGGSIDLLHHQDNAYHYIQVKDTGIGMSPHQLAQLFQLGEQNSRQGTASEKGTGLGLVLVKELVEANGGMIKAIGEVNKGTTFIVNFKK